MSELVQTVDGWMPGLWAVAAGVIILGGLLALTTGMIWIERRLLAGFQDRIGPNRVGPAGLLQPIADVIKLFTKEDWVPPFADRIVFVIAPAILVTTVLIAFAAVPFGELLRVTDANVGVVFVLAMLSMGVYSIVLAGWSSNSKYSMIGGMRAAAQIISYDLALALSVAGVVMLAGSLNLNDVVDAQRKVWFCALQPLGFLIFLTAGVAEARRNPFDLPEADSEIVAGYHTEYSSMKFALFFMGEYLDIILISTLTALLFLGGWHGPVLPGAFWFAIKTGAVIFFFVWLRAVMPRFRYDQLMSFGWKVLMPLALLNLLVTGAVALVLG